MSFLKAERLSKSYRERKVVNNLSLEIHRGEVVGLLGPNGAGKTTTFYIMVGLIKADGGRIFINSEEITHYPMYIRARKGIGYLPQEPSIFRKLNVEENLLAILETLGIPPAEQRQRAEALLEELGVAHLAKSKAFTLSGGERRRVEIARALVTSPSFILLDEPFTGIDPKAIADIQTIICELKEKGIGILVTDHNVRETLQITDRAYIISDGRILRAGTPQSLGSDAKVREVYLGEKFKLD
ncbi:MAG: LPS export ABC transporter ATP-binding protein [Candidatus Aminicenantes bacterium]|nr:LPS export ABC transporter ATP-binding protein [Candidatus Aminicenantes bacterium]MDH5715478.1 LPS export ABC transporter ATP-binding protein [Candidatus Aminicenantes bacterium]